MNNSKQSALYIQADNVHVGGGRSLLSALIQAKLAENACLLLDARMPLDLVSSGQVINIVQPTIFCRLIAQFWLLRKLVNDDILLCFGNLPPLFNVRGRIVVFVHNRYVIDDSDLKFFSIKVGLRLFFERIWFKSRCHKVNEFIVQTSSMQILLKNHLLDLRPGEANKIAVRVLPFMDKISSGGPDFEDFSDERSIQFDYIYPASGEAHKNHQKLIDAFVILAEQGHFPSLVLTLDENKFPEILHKINLAKVKFNLNIHNVGFLPHLELMQLYSSIRFLIYPSLYESFGIPLLEAKHAGLSIVAGELDYVRDSVSPVQTFDPNSATSIARAIKRSLRISDELAAVLSADEFLSKISSSV